MKIARLLPVFLCLSLFGCSEPNTNQAGNSLGTLKQTTGSAATTLRDTLEMTKRGIDDAKKTAEEVKKRAEQVSDGVKKVGEGISKVKNGLNGE